jgi:hypothetical protein
MPGAHRAAINTNAAAPDAFKQKEETPTYSAAKRSAIHAS